MRQDGGIGGDLARAGVSVGRDVRRLRNELLAVQRGGRACRTVPVRCGRHRDAGYPARDGRLCLALLPAVRAAGAAVWVPRARAVRPRTRAALQPGEAVARPVREGGRRRSRLEPGVVLLPARLSGRGRRSERHRDHGLRTAHGQGRGHQPVLRLERRGPAPHVVPRHRHLRGPRQGADRAAPGPAGRDSRHVRRSRAPGHRGPSHAPRRDGRRADAGARVRQRPAFAGCGTDQLLGLQHHRLLRPASRVLGIGGARKPGAGVQVHGQDAAQRRHRGDPRRRLQPHRRGQ